MGILDRALQAFDDAEKEKKNRVLQQKRQATLTQYWDNYWCLALVIWEITHANRDLLKIHLQKAPKWLKPTTHEIKDLNKYDFMLYRLPTNTPSSDGAVLKHEVTKVIKDYLTLCNFSCIDVETEEDTYKYYLSLSIPSLKMGRPMSPKIGRLSVRRFYDANYDLYYLSFAIQYFDGSPFVGIKDNANINLYHAGQFIQATTMRDTYGNIGLSRLPFRVRADYNYLVIV